MQASDIFFSLRCDTILPTGQQYFDGLVWTLVVVTFEGAVNPST